VGRSVAAFAVFAAVVTLTPGLDTMLVLRTTALASRRAGLCAVAGIAAGCLVWAAASALGVTAILAASRLAFDILRVAGAAYLCWLGVRALVRAHQPGMPAANTSTAGSSTVEAGLLRAFRTGLTTNLLNPKVGIFYLSVMPAFLPAGVPPLAGSLLLGAVHVAEGILWLGLVVLAVNTMRGWLTRPAVKRRLDQLTGLAFLAFGARLAVQVSDRTGSG
jgi:threonine/homoserine/homoserine lactone efflux protein